MGLLADRSKASGTLYKRFKSLGIRQGRYTDTFNGNGELTAHCTGSLIGLASSDLMADSH